MHVGDGFATSASTKDSPSKVNVMLLRGVEGGVDFQLRLRAAKRPGAGRVPLQEHAVGVHGLHDRDVRLELLARVAGLQEPGHVVLELPGDLVQMFLDVREDRLRLVLTTLKKTEAEAPFPPSPPLAALRAGAGQPDPNQNTPMWRRPSCP